MQRRIAPEKHNKPTGIYKYTGRLRPEPTLIVNVSAQIVLSGIVSAGASTTLPRKVESHTRNALSKCGSVGVKFEQLTLDLDSSQQRPNLVW